MRIYEIEEAPGRLEIRFKVYVRGYFRAAAEGRQYKMGVQLWGLDAEGRARAHLYMHMRAYIHDNGSRLGWDVMRADFKYSDVTVDQVGRLGETGPRLLGDTITGAIEQWFPQVEREAVARVEKAVQNTFSGSRRLRSDVARVIRTIARTQR